MENKIDYLEALIKPWRDRVNFIRKYCPDGLGIEHIAIHLLKDDYDIVLPHFATGTMYRGMEAGRKYTLEELGL